MDNLYIFFGLIQLVACSVKELQILNRCPFTVWPVIKSDFPKENSKPIIKRDFRLNEWESLNISVNTNWSGEVWGKTKCPENGICETGGCIDGRSPENICDGIALPPVSTAKFHLGQISDVNGTENEELDVYSMTLLSGYNIPIQIRPYYQSVIKSTNKRYDCNLVGCFRDVNSVCPEKLSKRNRHGIIVGCQWEPNMENYSTFIEACPDTIIYNNRSEVVSKESFSDSKLKCKSRMHEYAIFQVIFCP